MVEELFKENEDNEINNISPDQLENLNQNVRWCIFNKINYLKFVGKDVIALSHDIYIMFMNLRTSTNKIYQANSKEKGDGVDCISGCRCNFFAFAEKTENPRIFICSYPSFKHLGVLRDSNVSTYKQICMTDADLLIAFSRLPDYTISVWSWRTFQKYVSMPTNVIRSNQVYLPSRTHSAVAQSWGIGLTVWEIAPCNKVCMLMKKTLSQEIPEIHNLCWTADGNLYAIDKEANLYGIISDNVGLVAHLEWSSKATGNYPPNFCSYSSGMLLIGPDGFFRYLKKVDKEWEVHWLHDPKITILKIVSNYTVDVAVAVTHSGMFYQITNNVEDEPVLSMLTYKPRNIKQFVIIFPSGSQIATLNDTGELCIHNIDTGNLCAVYQLNGKDLLMNSSRVQPILVVSGELGNNYGITLITVNTIRNITECNVMCSLNLTNQIIDRVSFSSTNMDLVAVAMSAGHIFAIKTITKPESKLNVAKYIEVGRGLADVTFVNINNESKIIGLVRFSENYKTGEKLVCYDTHSGQEYKVVGKILGSYKQLRAMEQEGKMLAIPHLSRQLHIMKLSSDRGSIIQVKVEHVLNSEHELSSYSASINPNGLVTFGIDGLVHLKRRTFQRKTDKTIIASHRYSNGIQYAAVNQSCNYIVSLTGNQALAVHYVGNVKLDEFVDLKPVPEVMQKRQVLVDIFDQNSENWHQVQERRRIEKEAAECMKSKLIVLEIFETLQERLQSLLEENLAAPMRHQVPLNEFNLHLEAKQLRIKQAAEEREAIRFNIENKIIAQNKVTDWIKKNCWESMKVPRVKLFEIFSHYVVENYGILLSQRDVWTELQHVKAWRAIEMEKNDDLLRPWLPKSSESSIVMQQSSEVLKSDVDLYAASSNEQKEIAIDMQNQYVLSGTLAHNYIDIPNYNISQMCAYSYLHLQWMQQITKWKAQEIRLWFNRQFDEMMTLKCREVSLVEERNKRLRIIISELNTLSALRGSDEIISIVICDPEWSQEEIPSKLTKVEPEEVSVTPYISPSQVVIPPPEPVPKDDFRERALMDMMDGVLEKLWHEEIKKPIPRPSCMNEKEPENWNEDDLRDVYEYEAKVEARNGERDKYRKMLHSEYEKIVLLLNEGVVRFNNKIKQLFVTKLQVETAIQQENLAVTRMKRVNLEKIEDGEKSISLRNIADMYEKDIEKLQIELKIIQEQLTECHTTYETLSNKDKMLDKNFKSNFLNDSSVVVDQCYRMFKKRPKWIQRASMIPVVLMDMAHVCVSGVTSPFLHADCVDYLRGIIILEQKIKRAEYKTALRINKPENERNVVKKSRRWPENLQTMYTDACFEAVNLGEMQQREGPQADGSRETGRRRKIQMLFLPNIYYTEVLDQMDAITNMPPIMDVPLWTSMCKLRRTKIENEIKLRAVCLETANAESALSVWSRAVTTRKMALATANRELQQHKEDIEARSRDKTIQLTLKGGFVELPTTGHIEDFDDALLIRREDVETVNNMILKVGQRKLNAMLNHMKFQRLILTKEWEHAQLKMRIRHMEQELYAIQRIKVTKELQAYLKGITRGWTDEQDYTKMERETEATKSAFNKLLYDQIHKVEEIEGKLNSVLVSTRTIDDRMFKLKMHLSEKRHKRNSMEVIRQIKLSQARMKRLVQKSKLVRKVQDNYTNIVLLQTELELLRLKTYPTLSAFHTLD